MGQETKWQVVIQLPSGEYAVPIYFYLEKGIIGWIGTHSQVIEILCIALKGEIPLKITYRKA